MYPFRIMAECDGTTQRKGLNGVAIWSKTKPQAIVRPMAVGRGEGRIVTMVFKGVVVINVYTPNSQAEDSDRAAFRHAEWDPAFRSYVKTISQSSPVVVCGDFNVAAEDIDVACPDEWADTPGLLAEERAGFGELLDIGLIDVYRHTHLNEDEKYTYWNMRVPWERTANVGWRIDYFLISRCLIDSVMKAQIFDHILGSDHCPIYMELSKPNMSAESEEITN
tara:strand:+ start:26875 stop:27540 length:666 start_codon:yes stop_codon:yes gene_type:complete